ncbi:MAG: DUF308 domain-containing protein [Chryseosolibacter sp.]
MNQLTYNWWTLALRGGLGILLGLTAFFFPGITLSALIILFGAFTLLEGAFLLIAGVRSRKKHERWGILILHGVLSILVAIIAFAAPLATALALLYLIAAWALLSGLIEIAAAIKLRKQIQGEWALALEGVVTILFAVSLVILPGAGLVAMVWMSGAFWLASGIVLIILAIRLKKEDKPGFSAAG